MPFSLPISPLRQARTWWPILGLLVLLSSVSFEARAGHGIFEGIVKVGSSFYNLNGTSFTTFQSANLGSFNQGQSLVLAGGEVKTFKNNNDDVTGANLFYLVYPQNARPSSPAFNNYTLPFALNLNSSDQSWNTFTGTVNLLDGLPVGDYTLEVFERSGVNYNGGGSGFDYLSNNSNPTNYTASFSVTAPTSSGPLPVELTSFEATRQGPDAALKWATASEKNNMGFAVQVSTDGLEFRSVGFVAGAGSSTASHRYYFLDAEKNKAGLRYYRLWQQNADGTASYSPVRTVDFAEAAGLSAAPQPFGAELALTLRTAQAQPGTLLTLTDATGRRVLARSLDLAAGTNQFVLSDLATVPAGVYTLQVALPGRPVRLRVVKQ
ncbi:hypothetical protein [Hymenobacter convexus]|uniref:hypothetical protein n=1 Tax=Hymenobacter sp. CA1UV-4 TaxID=3063782 RepID=UPI0027135C6F|nr:hypothetical protein [Hymenobacter sp. CA1UV-4]MDO7851084.1 hypothetical protein [Hymenobacter sp. CA1UV-4]